eukprot:7132796-Ditylum_brightwellii.AAC.1
MATTTAYTTILAARKAATTLLEDFPQENPDLAAIQEIYLKMSHMPPSNWRQIVNLVDQAGVLLISLNNQLQ